MGPCMTPICAPPAFSSKPPAICAAKFCKQKSAQPSNRRFSPQNAAPPPPPPILSIPQYSLHQVQGVQEVQGGRGVRGSQGCQVLHPFHEGQEHPMGGGNTQQGCTPKCSVLVGRGVGFVPPPPQFWGCSHLLPLLTAVPSLSLLSCWALRRWGRCRGGDQLGEGGGGVSSPQLHPPPPTLKTIPTPSHKYSSNAPGGNALPPAVQEALGVLQPALGGGRGGRKMGG